MTFIHPLLGQLVVQEMTEATPPRRARARALSYPDDDEDGSMPQQPMLVRRNMLPANDKHALVKRISIGSPLRDEKPAAVDEKRSSFSFGRDVKSETPNDCAFWCQIGGPAITRPVNRDPQLATARPGIKLKPNQGGTSRELNSG